ncbi:MAG: regulator of sirC expression with transglutaminase-like and TPR domain [Phenylobacterium sp.]|jgi:regulator of sirC expression with transglutaminase-like and TPR domain
MPRQSANILALIKEATLFMSEIRLSSNSLRGADLLTDILLFERTWDSTVDLQQVMVLAADIVEKIKIEIDLTETAFNRQVEAGELVIATDIIPDVFIGDTGSMTHDGAFELLRLNTLLDQFYIDMAFSPTPQEIPESLLNSLSYIIQYHTGEAMSMSILLNHLILETGFDCNLVVAEHEIMLRVSLSDNEYVLIDALCGEVSTYSMDGGRSVLPSGKEGAYRALDRMSVIQIFLSQQKLAFTDEGNYEQALCCIELLIKTMPEDPYQRRDRGFLLQQLDCLKLAQDDFKFFIEQCPQDPAAQMLQMEIEDFEGHEHTIH